MPYLYYLIFTHLLYDITPFHLLMIDQKLAIITIHDVAPTYLEKTLQVSDELNKLKIHYNLGIVPYYEKNIISKTMLFSVIRFVHYYN
jgi:hypothetical protein